MLLFGLFLVIGVILGKMARTMLDDAIGAEIGIGDRLGGALLGAVQGRPRRRPRWCWCSISWCPLAKQPQFLNGSQLRPLFSAAGQSRLPLIAARSHHGDRAAAARAAHLASPRDARLFLPGMHLCIARPLSALPRLARMPPSNLYKPTDITGSELVDLGIKGRRAIVCASSKGLGRACAIALANEGVHVTLTARGAEALKQTADEIRKAHPGRHRHRDRRRHHDAGRSRGRAEGLP